MSAHSRGMSTSTERKPGDVPRTLLIADAARLMRVSRRTVYYRLREGQLESVKTRCGSRRIVVHSLEQLLWQGLRKNAASRRHPHGTPPRS
ncbi:MAG: helix-turn-helix domain-containing protein, partial [Vicinamibacterales bacterium]